MGAASPGREAIVGALRRALAAHSEVVLAVLHGSFARGGAQRDVDVAVWLDEPAAGEGVGPVLDLAQELTTAAGAPVDVQVLNRAAVAFRYHALAGEPLLVRDAELLAELKARTWDEYFDFAPFARQYLRDALRD
jgi:predicted nucleotidyltransferase